VYEGGIRTPLLAWQPGTIKAGTVTDHAGYFPDVMPTLLEMIGAADAVPKGIDGVSFAPTLRGQTAKQKPHEHMVWEFHGYGGQQAVRLGDWKGVRQKLHQGVVKTELYDLKTDEAEKNDLAAKHPDVVKRIEEILRGSGAVELFPIKVLDS
jgi:arylsulfatase